MSSYGRSLMRAINRSVDVLKHSAAGKLRMDVTRSAESLRPMQFWSVNSSEDLDQFATGCDRDIGGLSNLRLDYVKDEASQRTSSRAQAEGYARFWGTLSNQVPRGAKIMKSGYVAMRNKVCCSLAIIFFLCCRIHAILTRLAPSLPSQNRPTLFGTQTWNSELHPYLALRVRNSLALPSPPRPNPFSSTSQSSDDLASALQSPSLFNEMGLTAAQRARMALGAGLPEPLGPKYFVNIQTDGPIVSDLFQHRIWFSPNDEPGQWQTIVIPFDAFVLSNTGAIAANQITMMREKIRTIGISCLLETPRVPGASDEEMRAAGELPPASDPSSASPAASGPQGLAVPGALQRTPKPESELAQTSPSQAFDEGDDFGCHGQLVPDEQNEPGQRGTKRGQSFRFDLGIQGAYAVSSVEEAQELWS